MQSVPHSTPPQVLVDYLGGLARLKHHLVRLPSSTWSYPRSKIGFCIESFPAGALRGLRYLDNISTPVSTWRFKSGALCEWLFASKLSLVAVAASGLQRGFVSPPSLLASMKKLGAVSFAFQGPGDHLVDPNPHVPRQPCRLYWLPFWRRKLSEEMSTTVCSFPCYISVV